MSDNTYQTDIAIKQGGGSFLFFGDEISASDAQKTFNLGILKADVQTIANSAGAGSGVLSTVTVPNVGIVVYSLAAAASNASALIGSCLVGDEKLIIFKTTGAAASVIFSTATASIFIYGGGGQLSSITAHGSAASNPVIRLTAIDTDTWAVTDVLGATVTLRKNA